MTITTSVFMKRTAGRAAADLPLRLALGSSMLYHGISKLRAEGRAATGGWFESIGFKPGQRWAGLVGLAETFAGAAAILGIATRPAALAVLATQAVAIAKVHRPKGFDITNGGYEYNLALMSIAVGLLANGAGPLSTSALAQSALARRRKLPARVPFAALRRFGAPSALERGLAVLH